MPDIRVVYAADGREGLAAIARETPSVILTDLVMPDMGGLELVQRVRAEHPEISVILMTAFGSEEVAMQTLRAGAANYIPKRDLARDLPDDAAPGPERRLPDPRAGADPPLPRPPRVGLPARLATPA